jgi:hypothetical protein
MKPSEQFSFCCIFPAGKPLDLAKSNQRRRVKIRYDKSQSSQTGSIKSGRFTIENDDSQLKMAKSD